jgi:lysyl-tRNA synthetase class I
MNELDNLEDVYFGKKQVSEKDTIKLKGLFQYCWVMEPPIKSSVHVPYNLLAFLVKMAPKECLDNYVTEKLQSYGYLQKNQTVGSDLAKRVEFALNWTRDFEEIKETAVPLSDEEKKAVSELIQNLETATDPDKIQNAIYNAAKNNGLQLSGFFKVLYTVLI